MDMKKILQAMDGIATKPVEGVDSMAKFLRVVSEAEINQPVPAATTPAQQVPDTKPRVPDTKPRVPDTKPPAPAATTPATTAPDTKPTPVPAMPDISGLQAGGDSKDLGDGTAVKIGADGNVQYMGAWGTYVYNPQGQHVSTISPRFQGAQQTTNAQGQVTSQNYNQGDIDITQGPDGTQASYQLGPDKLTHATDAQGNVKNTMNGQPVQESSLRKFLSIVDKNNVSILSEGANPHKVTLPVQMAMQHYQQPKTKPQPRERLIDKYFVEAETEIIQRKEEKRALINQYAKTIAERVLMKESAQSVTETPIEMTGDPNDPHIYGHEKANPMSLKGRIGQARAQLKELAELAESDSLLAWEEICKKAKGGMFMGLEQNLEQIRHGISELAAKRKKGGVQSRGINPHIGEESTSPVVNKVANTLVSAGANARQAVDKAVSSIPRPFDEKEVANDLKAGQGASITKKK